MNKTQAFFQRLHILFYVIVVLQSAVIAYLVYTIQNNNKYDTLKEETDQKIQMLYNELDYKAALSTPTVVANGTRLAIPELGITLPYNPTTSTFRYSFDGTYLRVTSTLLSDHTVRQMGCNELALVTLGDGAALNPWTQAAGSLSLANNKTLSIIKPIAFSNSEASTEACATEVWVSITPDQVVEEFKYAGTY